MIDNLRNWIRKKDETLSVPLIVIAQIFGYGMIFSSPVFHDVIPGWVSRESMKEIGWALVGGSVIAAAVLAGEHCFQTTFIREERRLQKERIREQYQMTLGLADSLANKVLSGLDLEEIKLPGRELIGAQLVRTNLRKADLSGSNLSKAKLHGARLPHSSLRDATLVESDLSGAVMKYSNPRRAVLRGAVLR